MNNGKIINEKYELIEKIGQGAFGQVFKAKNTLFNKIIALKIIEGSSERQLTSFLHEIRKMDKLEPYHFNVIKIISADIIDNALIIEMEYFEGITLLKLLNEKLKLDDELIIEYAKQILDALSFIHSKRLVHRDLKPDNILLNKDRSLIKISDFGISKDLDYSTSNSIQGAIFYMSPEQLIDPNNVDHRSDFYSLAIILYQIKTGEIPFAGSITNAIDGKRFKDIPKTNSFLDPIIQKASKKNPKERYNNAEEFKNELTKAFLHRKKNTNSKAYLVVSLVILAMFIYVLKHSYDRETRDNVTIPNSEINKPNNIRIGNQFWIDSNLKNVTFQNGDSIFEAKNKKEWDYACLNKRPSYCHVDNNETNDNHYGLLYNWYAVNDIRNISPIGYRIPTYSDFQSLLEINPETLHSKLNLPFGGWRGKDGFFHGFEEITVLWTCTPKYDECIYTVKIKKGNNQINFGEQPPQDGYSVRCIKE